MLRGKICVRTAVWRLSLPGRHGSGEMLFSKAADKTSRSRANAIAPCHAIVGVSPSKHLLGRQREAVRRRKSRPLLPISSI